MNFDTTFNVTDSAKKSWTFDNLMELKNFIQQEKDFWEEKRNLAGNNNRNIHQYLNSSSALKNILSTIKRLEDETETLKDDHLAQRINILKNNDLNNLKGQWLWSDHDFTNAYIDCHIEHSDVAAGAFYDFIVNKKITNNNNLQDFLGKLVAYEFAHQDSELVKRSNSERKSLEHLRSKLDKQTTSLITEVEEFKEEFSNWDESTKKAWGDWLEHSSKEHENQKEENKNKFDEHLKEWTQKISDLETTYQEKLRLEKPAEYWKKASKKFQVQGVLWILALVASILLGVYYFHDFFIAWLTGQEMDVKLESLQGVVIYVSFLTVYIFLIKTLSKLTFSTFHLMRDAEEREQLTYLYLSLNENSSIDKSSRDIILQALFSRTETGLLSSESSPTMPGVAELLKTAGKN